MGGGGGGGGGVSILPSGFRGNLYLKACASWGGGMLTKGRSLCVEKMDQLLAKG